MRTECQFRLLIRNGRSVQCKQHAAVLPYLSSGKWIYEGPAAEKNGDTSGCTIYLVTIVVMTVLLGLSRLGVDTTPLLAGAGILGLAIGFGAQTLVRDVVSGIFFLIDDAFRVGEYLVIFVDVQDIIIS